MAERILDHWLVRSSATLEGTRYTALRRVSPQAGGGYPVYYAVCENRSFRSQDTAEQAAAKALADLVALEADGAPIFPDGYTGFDDPAPPA
jgi:hypothetical protein